MPFRERRLWQKLIQIDQPVYKQVLIRQIAHSSLFMRPREFTKALSHLIELEILYQVSAHRFTIRHPIRQEIFGSYSGFYGWNIPWQRKVRENIARINRRLN